MTTIDGTKMIPFSPITRPADSGSLSAHAAGSPSRPASPTAATVASAASGPPKTNGQPATSGPTCAPSVASRSQNHRSATAPATAESDASNGQNSGDTGNGSSRPGNASVAPLNSRSYVDPPTVGTCGHCGAELKRKTRGGRVPTYCSSRCRVAAWRARRRAAGQVAALVLALLLTMIAGTAVHAQDGPTQQQQEVNSSQGQDVNVNVVCEHGSTCYQDVTVGGQEPPTALQENSAPAAAVPTPYPCLYFEAWDPVTESCFVKQDPPQSLGDDPIAAAPVALLAFGLLVVLFGGAFLRKSW